MIRFFLADDNRLVRESLLSSIDWEQRGFEVVGEAENGVEALQGIIRERPDVLILDIKMPGKNGLEVLEAVRKQGIPCECIIITGYDEFTYARQGIRLGVFDFLLKPVDNQELLNALERVRQKMEEKEKKAEIQEKSELMGEELCRHFLLRSIAGDREAIGHLENELKRNCRFSCYELMMICPESENHTEYVQLQEIFEKKEKEILERLGRDSRYYFLYTRVSKGLVVMILFRNIYLGKEYDVNAVRVAHEIFYRSKEAGVSVSIGISSHTRDIKELQNLYEQALYAHNSRFFFENRNVMHYATVKSKGIKNGYSLQKELDEFYLSLKEEPEKLPLAINQIGMLIEENASYDMEYIKNILIHMGLMMSSSLRKYCEEMDEDTIMEVVQRINEARCITEAVKWLEEYAQQILEQQKEYEGCRYSPLTRKILDYMKDNYGEKASLQEVSDYMGISVSHICRLLKNETGETFTALMNKIRIKKAIQMLRSGEYRVYEIAEKVGFGNYAYFYQLFKKETGCSPTEFYNIP